MADCTAGPSVILLSWMWENDEGEFCPSGDSAAEILGDIPIHTIIIVINGHEVLAGLDESYKWKLEEWKGKCASVRAGFKQKTSRSKKNGKVYESTNWYEEQPGGGLKSVGKEEPDYTKYYPPEPKPPILFKYREYDGHVLLEEKDFTVILALFKDCLVFRLDDCKNLIHPCIRIHRRR